MNENNITLKASLTIKDIALIGVMTATLEAGKYALSFIPNIENKPHIDHYSLVN